MNDYETQVLERLVRMETKLDYVNLRIDAHESRLVSLEKSTPDPDHEQRIRKLERALWIISGAASVGGGAAGAIVSQLFGA